MRHRTSPRLDRADDRRQAALLASTGRAVFALFVSVLALVWTAAAGAEPSRAATLPRLVPPPDGKAHFGFTFRLFDSDDRVWGDTRPFEERIRDAIENELAGKRPTFLTVWAPWQRPDMPGKPFVPFGEVRAESAKVAAVTDPFGVLYLDWTITSSTRANRGITTRDIAAGAADRYIRQYARDLKAYGKPVLIRLFAGEFNGSWWWGISPRANGFLTTAHFVKAWRRVVDIFAAIGAVNVSWAWVPNAYGPLPDPSIDPDIGAYYPGDDYVDWAGADVYDVGGTAWLDGPYAFAVAHAKPLFIAEWGVRHEWSGLTPAQQRDWIDAMFSYFETHPAIKAVAYFNYCNRIAGTRARWDPARDVPLYGGQVTYQPNANDHDHRLLADSGAGFRTTFAQRISSARYVAAVSTEPVEAPPEAEPVVQLLEPLVRGGRATIRWRRSLLAASYDVATRPPRGRWRIVAARRVATSYRVRRPIGARLAVRVRARGDAGDAGAWSASQTVAFVRRNTG